MQRQLGGSPLIELDSFARTFACQLILARAAPDASRAWLGTVAVEREARENSQVTWLSSTRLLRTTIVRKLVRHDETITKPVRFGHWEG
jgi:hypothetical protein